MAQIVKQAVSLLSGLSKSKGNNISTLSRFPKTRQFLQRCYSKTDSTDAWLFNDNDDEHLNEIQCKEISIPVPYGHIAGKAWGRDNGYPILAFHGWLDNCGTFDKLIPLLSRTLYVVAIDAPGHGLSSHKPPGCYYRDLDLLIDFKRVVDYMGWQKCSLMGHSMGGGLALMFSSLFPDIVRKLVVLDIVKPTSRSVDYFPEGIVNAISQHMKIEKKLLLPPPVYTKEDAVNRLREGMFKEITQESAEILIKRGAKLSEHGNGHVFTRDLRCRTIEMFSRVSHETMIRFMSNIKCELMMILGNNTHENYKPSTPEMVDEFIEIYRSNLKTFKLNTVEGNHFVHLNNPENIAPLIDEFFQTERGGLNLEIKNN